MWLNVFSRKTKAGKHQPIHTYSHVGCQQKKKKYQPTIIRFVSILLSIFKSIQIRLCNHSMSILSALCVHSYDVIKQTRKWRLGLNFGQVNLRLAFMGRYIRLILQHGVINIFRAAIGKHFEHHNYWAENFSKQKPKESRKQVFTFLLVKICEAVTDLSAFDIWAI